MIWFILHAHGASHIDASSVVWTLINDGKLANEIARLVAIVVKIICDVVLSLFSVNMSSAGFV